MVVMGLGYGCFVAVSPLVLADLFGVVGLGSLMGILYTTQGLGALFGPPIAGRLIDVYGGYTMYEVDTDDDQTFAGLLAADTPVQITLKLPLGLTKTIPRKNILTLRASPKSLMPDQLEKTLTKQELKAQNVMFEL